MREWQSRAAVRLEAAGVPSAHSDAEALLEAGTGLGRTARLLRAQEALHPETRQRLDALLARRLAREPLQYLLGEVEWGGVRLRCDPRALIPRPETEWLLHLALHDPATARAVQVADIGTGTGALALGWKAARPQTRVTATDLSADALALARENAALNGLDVSFYQGDLLAPLTGQTFGLILSNPPYLPDQDRGTLAPEVDHDPALALYGGPDGLTLARRLAAQAPARLAAGGVLWLELDGRNAPAFAAELAGQGWQAAVHADLTGRQRFVRAVRAEGQGLKVKG
ncbi:protein-(glutamine-N5) methyltransferase, release factor-specific [Deinococcus proteolyticus MRP]|uniref:Release factor glutamine methyltransferase n=1 Tax=Deinococcus proteolyticus (strain ATCC 35074 / DSM 20540 / JCM 6276 / NBRC 101906 / NCIMB 13154 / VKM Ac-1939 / CCM 2703 / MRP) TaxID=693977 RepID=F0RJD7_DEIPM|nr:peptide chain release factor N(5)-glutamine methyltransferase [Deinococcus proteolyticus]ADY25478.1 protein-(glutamine-N5) methyltransferase, release factor-specific [Deinococcus proteolyticus MRP]